MDIFSGLGTIVTLKDKVFGWKSVVKDPAFLVTGTLLNPNKYYLRKIKVRITSSLKEKFATTVIVATLTNGYPPQIKPYSMHQH